MDVRAILMGLAFVVMWSSAFSSARIIVADAPPLNALALRFLISGLIGVAIARALGQSWTLSRGQWHLLPGTGIEIKSFGQDDSGEMVTVAFRYRREDIMHPRAAL